MAQLPTSGWLVTEENVRKQIKTPFGGMPAYPGLSEEEMNALLAFLKSL
jgi:hypothetical protein